LLVVIVRVVIVVIMRRLDLLILAIALCEVILILETGARSVNRQWPINQGSKSFSLVVELKHFKHVFSVGKFMF
jgi:hypothetical protein